MTGEAQINGKLAPDTSVSGELDARAGQKSPSAFKTISEVAEILDIPQHVLRFWETKFKQIKPVKRSGGRRYYRPQDVLVISQIKHLLYNEGYTIKGARQVVENSVSSIRNGAMNMGNAAAAESGMDASHQAEADAPEASANQLDFGFEPVEKKLFPRKALQAVLGELYNARELLKSDA